ncbi:MAG: hypothetical protein QGH46_09090 [Gammaproteobacteria bacterium]|nr:hypothetical protein [Gammaproteobacteria bacterium]HJP04503.1 hypothetical protein [Gammaproteobacteria bacterium]
MNKILQIIVSLVFITGCARSVTVLSDFPEPVVEPLPLAIGIRYPAELAEYVHVEDPMMDAEWTIRLGEANMKMFRVLFASMFDEIVELEGTAAGEGAEGVDAIIEPRLEELEFTVPRQSGNDQYTVWLRYNLRILSPEGKLIGDWRITAYGQEDEGSMGTGAEDSMKEAAITALRDVAASIIIGFTSAPGVQTLLPPKQAPENDQAG